MKFTVPIEPHSSVPPVTSVQRQTLIRLQFANFIFYQIEDFYYGLKVSQNMQENEISLRLRPMWKRIPDII